MLQAPPGRRAGGGPLGHFSLRQRARRTALGRGRLAARASFTVSFEFVYSICVGYWLQHFSPDYLSWMIKCEQLPSVFCQSTRVEYLVKDPTIRFL